MSLIKWNNLLDRPITNLFDTFFGWDLDNLTADWKQSSPAVNVKENKDDYKVELAIPGMSKDNFNVRLENDILTISGEKEEKVEDKKDNYMRQEFKYSSFERSFHLPTDLVDDEKIEANYKDGILLITIPKKENAKALKEAKQILIS